MQPIKELRVSLAEVTGPRGMKLGPELIDVRVVHLRHRSMTLPATRRYAAQFPDLLLRDDRTALPPKGDQGGFGGGMCTAGIAAHRSRQFWVSIHVPTGAPSGLYHGTLTLSVGESPDRRRRLPVELEVISYWTTHTGFPLFYRALAGLYNTRCGYEGTAPWAYQDYPDVRLYTEPAHAVAYPDERGQPIPTLRWESLRDGIDDVRYLQALDRALAAADARLVHPDAPEDLVTALARAREVRRACYESIDGQWFHYTGRLMPGDLEQVRRRLADATVALARAVSKPAARDCSASSACRGGRQESTGATSE